MFNIYQLFIMSLCIRAVPSKLSSLVGTRNQVMQLDRRLTKHIKKSSSLLQKNDKLAIVNISIDDGLSGLLQKKLSFDINRISVRLYSTPIVKEKENVQTNIEDKFVSENKNDDNRNGPTQKQLEHVFKVLSDDLPHVFAASLDYRIYHRDVEFINNVRGVSSKGLNGYIKQVLWIRTLGHLMYAYVKFDVFKITMHPEDNTIRVRWRVRGLSGFKVVTNIWKFKITKVNESINELETWYDGFSTYYVGKDGLVYKHVADKMMPDEQRESDKDKTGIAAKLTA